MENSISLASQNATVKNESINSVATGEVKTPEPKGALGAGVDNLQTVKDTPTTKTSQMSEGAENKPIEDVGEALTKPSHVATVLGLLGEALPKETKYLVLYSAAKKAGMKVAFLVGNREVYKAQLEALLKSVKESGKCMFDHGAYVVPLRPILEKFPTLKAYDIYSNEITIDTPDLDMYFVVYDGQHRIAVCESHPREADVWLELNDFNGDHPLEAIKRMNSYSRNWNCTDLRVSNNAVGKCNSAFFKNVETLQDLYGVTTKMAAYIVTMDREAIKKKDLVAGKDYDSYTDAKAERGIGIYDAAMMNFGSPKELKKLEFWDAIYKTYDKTEDADKPQFARNMKLYMGTLSVSDRNNVVRYITDKDFGKLNSAVRDGYMKFCETEHSEEEFEKLDTDISIFAVNLRTQFESQTANKPLKSGTVSEILKHNAKEPEKADKSKTKADKSKAKENTTDQTGSGL